MAEEVKETYTAEEVEKLKAELEAKHNAIMTGERKKHEAEIDKLKLTETERLEKEKAEHDMAIQQELDDLRAYKRDNVISQRLAKENLPTFFKNDTRLINAKDDKELELAIKSIKSDYSSYLPKGATHSTVVNSSSSQKDQQVSGAEMDEIIRAQAGR